MNRKRIASLVLLSVMSFLLININLFTSEKRSVLHEVSRKPASTSQIQETIPEPPKPSEFNPKITAGPRIKLARAVEKSIAVYRKVMDYPSSTQPLDSFFTKDPLEQKTLIQQKSVLGLDSQTNELAAQIPKSYYTLEEEIIPLSIQTTTENSLVNTPLTLIIDNNKQLNISPLQTGIYQADLPLAEMSEGSHTLTIIAKFKNEEVINNLYFQVNKSLVEFVKTDNADIDPEGNLFFSNYFKFIEAGTYLIEGTLYTDDNQLIGKAHTISKVQPGVQTVYLSFYGYLLFQKRVSGNFILRNIQINQVDERLVTRGNYVKQINQRTPYLTWEQFNSKPYNNELIHEKLSLLSYD